MTTVAEHTAAITKAYDTYIAELKLAGPHWDRVPAHGEGEEAWCARQVAEHIAGAALFFGSGIARAAGLPPIELSQPTLETAAAALKATPENQAKFMAVLPNIPAERMDVEFDAPRLGKTSINGLLGIVTFHLGDHANQLKKLREG